MATIQNQRPLPPGWRWVRLGEVCEFLDSRRVPVNDSDRAKRIAGKKESELFPYYGANGQVGWIDGYLFDEPLILLAEDGGNFGSADRPIAYAVRGRYWVNNHAHVLRPRDGVDFDFCLQALRIRPDVGDLVSGSTRAKLNQEIAISIPIPLPPLEEQKRIAAILNEQMGAVEWARAAAQAQLAAAKALPAAYLRAVFSSPEAQQWPRRRLGDFIASARNGFGRRPMGTEDGPIVLRLADVTNGCIDLSHPRHVAMSPDEIAAYRLQKGDVLFLRVNGSSDLVGRCVLVDVDRQDLAFNDHLIRVRLLDGLDAQYLKAVSAYPEVRSQIVEMASTSAGQLTVNQEALGSLAIPVPSLADQRRITATLNEQITSAERARKAIEEELDAINKLPAALLRRAFSGGL